MRITDKLADAKFSRGVAGYNIKEVDAFLQALSAEAVEAEAKMDTLQAALSAYDAEKEKIAQQKAAADELFALAEAKSKKLLSEAQAAARACERAAEIEAENLRASAESKAQNRLRAAQVQADAVLADAERAAKEKLDEANERAAQLLAAAEAKTAAEADRYEEIVSAGRAYTASVAEITEALREKLAALNDRTKPRPDAALTVRAARTAKREKKDESEAAAPQAQDIPMPEGRPAESRRAPGERHALRGMHREPLSQTTDAAPGGGEEETVREYSFAGGRPAGDPPPKSASAVRPSDTVNVTYDTEDDGFADVERIIASGKAQKKDPTDFVNG